MPSLSLSSGVAKARDTKRTTLITDEPFYLAGGLGVWDDNFDTALFYGALLEAAAFMKEEPDVVTQKLLMFHVAHLCTV